MRAENKNSWQEGDPDYRSFLLRCWLEDQSDETLGWRFVLVRLEQDPETNCFASVEKLLIYLREELQRKEPVPFENEPISQNSS